MPLRLLSRRSRPESALSSSHEAQEEAERLLRERLVAEQQPKRYSRAELEAMPKDELDRIHSERERAKREPELRKEERKTGSPDWDTVDYRTLLERSVNRHYESRRPEDLRKAKRLGIEGAEAMDTERLHWAVFDAEMRRRHIAELRKEGFKKQELEAMSKHELDRLYSDRSRRQHEPGLRKEERKLGSADWETASYDELLKRSIRRREAFRRPGDLKKAKRLGIEGAEAMDHGDLHWAVFDAEMRQRRIRELAGSRKLESQTSP